MSKASSLFIPERPASYIELRMQWRYRLSDTEVRELASEYLRGMVDECTTDAFAEYERRFGKHVKGASARSNQTKKRRSGK